MQGHLNKRTCYKKPEVIYFKQKRPESVTDTGRCFLFFVYIFIQPSARQAAVLSGYAKTWSTDKRLSNLQLAHHFLQSD